MRYLSFYTLLTAFLFSSCEEKINVLTDDSSFPVVYGVINPNDSIHNIRITKTFKGEGNNLEYALIADSSNVLVDSAQILAFSGSTLAVTYPLNYVLLNDKPEGDFFQGPNYAYQFKEADLSQYSRVRLRFKFEGKWVSADAPILGEFLITIPSRGSAISFVFNNVTGGDDPNFNDMRLSFRSARLAREHRASFRFNYIENYNDGSSELKSKSFQFLSVVSQSLTNPDDLTAELAGEQFFSLVQNAIEENPNVRSREIVAANISISAIGEEFFVYNQATSNSQGLGQSVINYTNVYFENGDPAVGVFDGARTLEAEHNLTQNSILALIFSEQTRNLKFCTGNQAIINNYPSAACQ